MRFGYEEPAWEQAKHEAKICLAERARGHNPAIAYSDLVKEIRSITIDAHDTRLNHLLDEISREEDAEGRGMMSVLVVHKTGDQMPGPGFFKLAKLLGRDVRDKEAFWISELEHVVHAHRG
jgi:hypothetical protein